MIKHIVKKASQSYSSQFIDAYQFFETDEALIVKTIPNGRFDLTINISGLFHIIDIEAKTNLEISNVHLFRTENKSLLLQFNEPICCFNIKFNPKIRALITNTDNSFDRILSEATIAEIRKVIQGQRADFNLETINSIIDSELRQYLIHEKLIEIIDQMMMASLDQKISHIAEQCDLNPKTINRMIKKHFQMTAKQFLTLLRFQETSKIMIKSKEEDDKSKMISELPLHYYDQSHFIKACRKITGKNPKEVFKLMKFSIPDLIQN